MSFIGSDLDIVQQPKLKISFTTRPSRARRSASPLEKSFEMVGHNIPNCMKEVTWLKLCLGTNGHRSAALEWLPFSLTPLFVQAAVIRADKACVLTHAFH